MSHLLPKGSEGFEITYNKNSHPRQFLKRYLNIYQVRDKERWTELVKISACKENVLADTAELGEGRCGNVWKGGNALILLMRIMGADTIVYEKAT